jgi:hypothetical protein
LSDWFTIFAQRIRGQSRQREGVAQRIVRSAVVL